MHQSQWIKLFTAGAVLAGSAALSRPAQAAIITNGVVQLGVNAAGHLNVPYPGDPLGVGSLGLRYVPTGNASTEPGCLCEGWGVGDAITGVAGWANQYHGGAQGLTLLGHAFTASSAISTVQAASTFMVTHDYHPSPATPNLFEVIVTIQNISGNDVDVRYRRVMDWDIYPTPFKEYVTIDPGNATELFRTDTDGFSNPNPFFFSSIDPGPVVDAGPADQGALFDFDFGLLAPGESKVFATFYGAAGSEADAVTSLTLAGAEAYSFGQPSGADGGPADTPNTFIFAFAGIGGAPLLCGNGAVEPGEQCDDGALVDGDGCDSNCTVTGCGNGVTTAGEQCDDGNLDDGDGCNATCGRSSCPDADGDGVCDDEDNCVDVYNPRQDDADGDGFGDACTPACLTLQRGGLGDVFDAYVSAAEPGNATTGAYTSLFTGIHGGGNKRSLLDFDLTPIPAGATILSAEMRVFLTWSAQPGTVHAHRITAPWSEANVSYNTFNNAFEPAILDSVALPLSTSGFQVWDLTGVVQAWMDGTLDAHGVLIEESGPGRHTYRSSEHGNASERPKLDVCYIAP